MPSDTQIAENFSIEGLPIDFEGVSYLCVHPDMVQDGLYRTGYDGSPPSLLSISDIGSWRVIVRKRVPLPGPWEKDGTWEGVVKCAYDWKEGEMWTRGGGCYGARDFSPFRCEGIGDDTPIFILTPSAKPTGPERLRELARYKGLQGTRQCVVALDLADEWQAEQEATTAREQVVGEVVADLRDEGAHLNRVGGFAIPAAEQFRAWADKLASAGKDGG